LGQLTVAEQANVPQEAFRATGELIEKVVDTPVQAGPLVGEAVHFEDALLQRSP